MAFRGGRPRTAQDPLAGLAGPEAPDERAFIEALRIFFSVMVEEGLRKPIELGPCRFLGNVPEGEPATYRLCLALDALRRASDAIGPKRAETLLRGARAAWSRFACCTYCGEPVCHCEPAHA